MKKIAIVIPARYASTRLPAKPLLEVKGKPIIQYVYEAAKKSTLAQDVIVATDDERIKSVVEAFGGKCEMTREDHKCGSDRIAEVANRHNDFDYILNLQGDEPQITPEVIDMAIKALIDDEAVDISTLVRKITSKEQIENPNCVKCVFDKNFNALYFSRCPIPYERNANEADYYAHIGIYGYKKSSLIKMTQLNQTPLEKQESLEQLRALENGMKIKVAITTLNPTGIDTIEDYEKFKKLIEG
ncbi:MAG: 3-deoxy-manno-octulosonate cytidylyltransferase [Candidatus Gastranaerophilales bacterium]|nr:3-deoxy-manno-octulosonate cytidylyltransferase [Candidatus Gastranaerophilales bacterium]